MNNNPFPPISKHFYSFLLISTSVLIFLSSSVYAANSSASYTLTASVFNSSGSSGQATTSFKCSNSVAEPVINLFTGSNYCLKAGFMYSSILQILSISVDNNDHDKIWNVGLVPVNSVITMDPAKKIIITNDGAQPEDFELRLINPDGWFASVYPGTQKYVLSGLFCDANEFPSAEDFNRNASDEDVITTESKKASNTIFGYNSAAANGASVPNAGSRALYLQFKSPLITDKRDEQGISVIISCQAS